MFLSILSNVVRIFLPVPSPLSYFIMLSAATKRPVDSLCHPHLMLQITFLTTEY